MITVPGPFTLSVVCMTTDAVSIAMRVSFIRTDPWLVFDDPTLAQDAVGPSTLTRLCDQDR